MHKSSVSENPLTVNVLRSPKNCCNLQKNTFILIFIILTQIELEKVVLVFLRTAW